MPRHKSTSATLDDMEPVVDLAEYPWWFLILLGRKSQRVNEPTGILWIGSGRKKGRNGNEQPDLRGKLTAVVQYNFWKGGGLIAVGYEARDEAKEVFPEIHLVQVHVARGKADLTIYRDAGSEVVPILAIKGRCERASIDEMYLDLTYVVETMLKETPLESLESIDEEVLKSHILGLISIVIKWNQRGLQIFPMHLIKKAGLNTAPKFVDSSSATKSNNLSNNQLDSSNPAKFGNQKGMI
ncbi:Y-family DNA polymerase H [Artemisia annua]|uniref:Y-family DNA polymerase H n=1 Tax=Artemisia annua TaxID=35608 RepID=A0A2U1QJZ8_ARTAN|nr:Y-family DNA polymerase H [Artemisia annua]